MSSNSDSSGTVTNADMIDVLVVGGGPGGSTAAAQAAKSGLRTVLIEKATFPRDKTCGDAIPADCLRVLHEELGHPSYLRDPGYSGLFYRAERFRVFGLHNARLTFKLSRTDEYAPCVIKRIDLDNLLFQFALDSGVELVTAAVTEPIIEGDQVVGVRAKQDGIMRDYRARVVIGADGATSVIGRHLGSVTRMDDRHTAVSARGYVETANDLDPTIDFAFLAKLQPGYAWFFPVGKRTANIGVGMRADHFKKQQMSLKDMLAYYVNTPQIRALISTPAGSNLLQNVKSWQIPMFSFDQQRIFNGALLIGDAGGFVDPITGAGIHFAILTGQYAAKTALAAIRAGDLSRDGLANYDQLWRARLGSDMRRSITLHNLFASAPTLIDLFVRIGNRFPGMVTRMVGKV